MDAAVAAAAALGLALVHLLAGRLRFLRAVPRSRWLSFGSGVSVAYVFVHLLPGLARGQEALADAAGGALAGLRHHAYLIALAGLAAFYGLERLAVTSRRGRRDAVGEDRTTAGTFWLHTASFATYNAVIGYLLLHRPDRGAGALAIFSAAMALHFLVNDYGLRQHHKERYDGVGRWVLAAAVAAGWAAGAAGRVGETVPAILTAFIGGGVVLNVLKEELPEERESRFGAFALGVVGYAALLLLR